MDVIVGWVQVADDSIKGGTLNGLDRQEAGRYIEHLVTNQLETRLTITVKVRQSQPPFIQGLRQPLPPMVE